MTELRTITPASVAPEVGAWPAFRKKPSDVHMTQLNVECNVQTSEGIMHGNEGDWLAFDPLSGHLWVVSDEYKTMHYEEA